ncbi:MAG: transcriptional repressor [Chloroflexi bacterium]|nr:transcriptional repressor [Chloroflexota bacterium]
MCALVSEAAAALRTAGGRMTAQRRLILETLETLAGHPTAEEVYALVRERDATLNPSTVYRTLAWLENAGLVSHCHLDAGPDGEHSERFDPVTPIEHHHFVCTGCGRVIKFESPRIEEIKAEFAGQHGGRVERAALTLYGVCGEYGSWKLEAGSWKLEAGSWKLGGFRYQGSKDEHD